jgi:hypothetical protein
VANVPELGPVFLAFSAVIFPMLIILGVMTLIRTIQIGVNDALLAQAINRIRHYYLELAPEAESYISFPHYDDPDAVQRSMMPYHFPLQGLASTPGPVVMINSVLAGVFASILVAGFLSLGLLPAIVIGLSVLVLALWLHILYSTRIWQRETRNRVEVRFPTPEN